MTMSTPARAPRHRLRRLSAAFAAIVALLATAPVGAVAAPGADGPPSQRPIVFSMAPAANGVVTADAPLPVAVQVSNPTDSTVAAGSVRLSTSTTPLSTRADARAWLADTTPDAARTERAVAEGEIAGIAAHGVGGSDVSIAAEALADLAPGVYPLRADYASAQGTLSSVSVIVVPGDAGTGALGVVVPITAPPITAGLLTATQLATLTDTDGALRAQLDAVTGTAAILAVDPAIAAAIRVLGGSAPATAVQWLDDLMTLPNPRFALQFGDADLATEIAAGLDAPLSVQTLAPYLSEADFTGTTPAPTPTSTPAVDDASALPTLDELTDIGAPTGNVFWPATGTAGADVVAALGARTVDDVASITLVDSNALTTDATSPAWTTAGDAQVLVYDADVSSALGLAAGAASPLARADARASASAYIALAAAAAPDTTLLVAVDRTDAPSGAALRAAISAAESVTGRAPADIASLTSGTPAAIELDSVTTASDRVDALRTLLDDEAALTSFATILSDPAVLLGPERASILQLLGNGWRAQPTRAQNAFEAHRAQTVTTLGSVTVVPPSDITLAATSGPLAFSVRNELAWPVSLVLIATPNDPRLIVQNTTPVEAGPAQNTRVQVPVEARVGRGESTLRLQLRSPVMVAVGDAVPVHVAVRAEWESVGIVVLATLVGGMIVLGTVRTVRKLRRRGEPADG